MRDVDADYAAEFTAVALTKNFRGSPHIDTQNIGPFYGLSLGDFRNQDQDEDTGGGGGGDESKATMSMNGGALCVESGPREVTFVDTRGKMARVDGRYPHWVESCVTKCPSEMPQPVVELFVPLTQHDILRCDFCS